mgnify:CR=1 FL=1
MKKTISLLLAITLPIWVIPAFIVLGVYEAYQDIYKYLWGEK